MNDKNVVPQEPTREQAELIAKTFRDQSNELHIVANSTQCLLFYYLGLKLAVDMAERFGLDTMESIVKYFEEKDNDNE